MHAHVFEYWKEMFMVHINIDLKKFKGQWVHLFDCMDNLVQYESH